ncbi:MAG: VanZ family protein [Anaerolineae bacterium]
MKTWRSLALIGPAVGWMALIYVVSAQPTLPTVGEAWLDRLVKALSHSAEYAILAILVARPALATRSRLSRNQVVPLLGLCFLYACSDEVHQYFVPGRVADVLDVAADTLGASLALLALTSDRVAGILRRLDPALGPR